MKYVIKLYAHGVTDGQTSWGVANFDETYIGNFYGRKENVPPEMIVEVKQFGANTNCYYTYYRTQNIYGNKNRGGSYFALTLRINYYYTDIQNIYNILDAAYNKFIVGHVVAVSGNVTKFLVDDLAQADSTLKKLEEELIHYLMQFSSDSDFVSLNGFKVNGQNEVATFNLFECDVKVAANHVSSHSSISVSPHHPSSREQQIRNEATLKVNSVKNQAEQDIISAKQNAIRDVNDAKEQARLEIAAALRDKEAGIQAIKLECQEADKTIKRLQEELKMATNEESRLTREVSRLKEELIRAKSLEARFHESQEQFRKAENVINRMREMLSNLSGTTEYPGMNQKHKKPYTSGGSNPIVDEEEFSFMKFVHRIHPFTDFFVMIVLLGIVGITLPKICEGSSKGSFATNREVRQPAKQQKRLPTDSGTDTTVSHDDASRHEADSENTLKERFPNARIDISGINPAKKIFMKIKNPGPDYKLSLVGVNEDLKGEWICDQNDFHILNDIIIPKRAGTHRISYNVDGQELTYRDIEVTLE